MYDFSTEGNEGNEEENEKMVFFFVTLVCFCANLIFDFFYRRELRKRSSEKVDIVGFYPPVMPAIPEWQLPCQGRRR